MALVYLGEAAQPEVIVGAASAAAAAAAAAPAPAPGAAAAAAAPARRSAFPARALIEGQGGKLFGTGRFVAAEMALRGVQVEAFDAEDMLRGRVPLTRADLVVTTSDNAVSQAALARLGVARPPAPDYPACLRPLLHRRLWTSTLGELAARLAANPAKRIFAKPAVVAKAFAGDVFEHGGMATYLLTRDDPPPLPASLEVVCSEVVEMLAEWRAYCVRGEVRSVVHYGRSVPEGVVLDLGVVREAARTLFASEEGRELVGCSIDFAAMRPGGAGAPLVTALIEVNDGFSLGAYDGVSAADYVDVLVARWHRLMEAPAAAAGGGDSGGSSRA